MDRAELYLLSVADLIDLAAGNVVAKDVLIERFEELQRAKQILADNVIEHQRAEAELAKTLARQLKELKTRERQATHDSLTHLPNRYYVEEHFPDLYHAARREGQSVCVYMLDIDYFKKINDTYGHKAGDVVLKEVAQSLRTHTRDTDILSRWGGEEFCLVGKGVTEPLRYGERLRTAIDDLVVEYTTNRGEVEVISPTLSVGCAIGRELSQEPLETLIELQENADRALYTAKANGRNRVVYYE